MFGIIERMRLEKSGIFYQFYKWYQSKMLLLQIAFKELATWQRGEFESSLIAI